MGACAKNGGSAAAANNARRKAQLQRQQTRHVAEIKAEAARAHAHPRLQQWSVVLRQRQVRRAYLNPYVQWVIALLIIGNFATNIVEKQIDPWGELYEHEWYLIETSWNCVFIIELLWNMWGCFYFSTLHGHFLRSPWNLFDLFVVAVSVPAMTRQPLGGIFGQLRMLRAFRVFRLFKRIESLNKIITSLGRAVPGIINAGSVTFLVMCIYAILGVDLFGKYGAGHRWVNVNGENVSLTTNRGLSYGEEYYGTFFRSLYTLFQVLTGESWSEVVARPAVFSDSIMYRSAIFYVTFIVTCGIVLVNLAVSGARVRGASARCGGWPPAGGGGCCMEEM